MTTKTNVFIEVVGSVFDTDIELNVQVAGAPLSISLAPKQPLNFLQIWNEVSDVMQNIAGFGLPDLSGGPWGNGPRSGPAMTISTRCSLRSPESPVTYGRTSSSTPVTCLIPGGRLLATLPGACARSGTCPR